MSTDKRAIQLEDLFRLAYVQDGRFSPDGSKVVYAVSQTEGEGDDEKDHSALWLAWPDTGEVRQLTSGLTSDYSPRWSPDGRHIAFISTRNEKTQIYLIPVDGGEARAITSLKQGVGAGPEWSPDGQDIAFSAGPDQEPRDLNKPYRVDRHPYRFDSMGYLDDVVQDIYMVSIESGEVKRLTSDRAMNSGMQWSPNGQEILFTSTLPVDETRWRPGLRIVNRNGDVRDVVWKWGMVSGAAWMPDSQNIIFIGEPFGKSPGAKSDLWVISAQGGTPECRTEGLKVGVGGGLQADMPVTSFYGPTLLITDGGKTVYTQVQEGGLVSIYRIALSGLESWDRVVGGERTCKLLDIDQAEGRMLYNVSTMFTPTDLYVADIEGGNEKPITAVNAVLLDELEQPKVENLHFKSVDGVEIEGWIMTPPHGEAPYPTILYAHGGPYGAFGNIYSFDFQMLAGAGYAVVFINYRGSTGYGDEFSTAITADWGNLDYHDHMAGLDYAIAKGLSDPDRLGVCGLSAGGYATCWIIGQTRRFKAAVPENPVTNLVTLYGISDIGTLMSDMMGGKPHEQPENYKRCSPITYAHSCTTPTLLIQGEADYRCPAEQSEQFFTVLKQNGCTVEMLRLPGSPHAGSIAGPPIIRRAHNEALLDWMNRYVLERSPGGTSA